MPTGKYTLFAWYKYNNKTYGKFLSVNALPSLEKRIPELKGLPISGEEALALKSSLPDGANAINFYCSNRNSVTPGSNVKKTSKIPYYLSFSLYSLAGRKLTPYKPNSKSQTYVYVFDAKGKAVIKKKMKTSKAQKGLKGKLSVGTYLVISWCDIAKDKRVGTCFYMTNAVCE